GYPSISVVAQYQESGTTSWQTFRDKSYTGPGLTMCRWVDKLDLRERDHWFWQCSGSQGLVWTDVGPAVFEQGAITTDTPAVIALGASDARSAQAADVSTLYTTIRTKLGQAGDPVQSAARALGGVKALIEGFVQL